MKFASPFDEAIFLGDIPAIFTLDPRGQLRLDPERTREIFILHTPTGPREDGFYALTDRATGLRMVMVTNHPCMAEMQPRAASARFATYAEAVAAAGSGTPGHEPPD